MGLDGSTVEIKLEERAMDEVTKVGTLTVETTVGSGLDSSIVGATVGIGLDSAAVGITVGS